MMLERRQHPRFRARQGTFVAMGGEASCMGQLVDVSLGGLSFHYMDHGKKTLKKGPFALLLGDDTVYLESLPCRLVEDTPISERCTPEGPHRLRHVRQTRLRFGVLTPDQKAQLSYFIRFCTEKDMA